MTSIKTQLPYDYYILPFCSPSEDTIRYKSLNLGEVLRGDRIVNTLYNVNKVFNLYVCVYSLLSFYYFFHYFLLSRYNCTLSLSL